VEVRDPLVPQPAAPLPLQLGAYVRAVVHGAELPDVVALPLTALHEDGTVWVMQDGMLAIRPVRLQWQDRDTVYLREGLEPGDRVVTSDLAAPVPGLRLRVLGEDPTPDPEDLEARAGGPRER
jgi:multidrug efflux pump subunit AcrA (membrane-fusion protein)